MALAPTGRRFVDTKPSRPKRTAPASETVVEEPEDADELDDDSDHVAPASPVHRGAYSFALLDARDTVRLGAPAVRIAGELPQWCAERPHAVTWPRAGWWTDALWPAPHEKTPEGLNLEIAVAAEPEHARERWSVLHGQIIGDHGARAAWILALDPRERYVGAWRVPPSRLVDLLAQITGTKTVVPDEAYWTITRSDLDDAATVIHREPVVREPDEHAWDAPRDEDEPTWDEPAWGEASAAQTEPEAVDETVDETPATSDSDDLAWLDVDPYALDRPVPHITDENAPAIGDFYRTEVW